MIRELINNLTFSHLVMCRAKGLVPDRQLKDIAVGAHSLYSAGSALATQKAEDLSKNEKELLKEAEFLDTQIEEAFVFLQGLEIC